MKKIVGFLLVLFISCGSFLTAEEAREANPASDFEYDLNKENTGVVIKGYKGEASDVVIPAIIKTFPVVAIGESAFENSNLESITIPDSVKTIGKKAFSSCTNLKTVTIGNGVKSIKHNAFENCNSLSDESKERLREVGYRGWF